MCRWVLEGEKTGVGVKEDFINLINTSINT